MGRSEVQTARGPNRLLSSWCTARAVQWAGTLGEQHKDRAHILGPWADWTFRDKGHTFSLSRGDAEASLSKC